jgi:hypothetical protein
MLTKTLRSPHGRSKKGHIAVLILHTRLIQLDGLFHAGCYEASCSHTHKSGLSFCLPHRRSHTPSYSTMATLDETHRNVFTVEDLASHNQPDNVWIAVDGKGWDSLNYLHRPYGC